MDIELLRTFLEVDRTCHFGKAGERLHITQSAVSARINLLERTIGVPLFIRSRNNIQLTPEGVLLKKYAETIVNSWVRARQDVRLPPEHSGTMAIGAIWDLWGMYLNARMIAVRNELPGTAFQIESDTSDVLVRKVMDGILDLAVLFEPPQVSGLEIGELGSITLVLVATRSGLNIAEALSKDYVMVDWGAVFQISHAHHFPDMPTPSMRVNLGALALHHILGRGGSAYLAKNELQAAPGKGKLFRVKDAPVIERRVYAIFRPDSDRSELIRTVLAKILVP